MSGTIHHMNRSVASDIEDLKRLQTQRDKLEKIATDYKAKLYLVETLTSENARLKSCLSQEENERARLDGTVGRALDDTIKEDSIVQHELELTKAELEKYRIYAEEIEKNNKNWRQECERQSSTLESLVDEAEELGAKLRDAEDDLQSKREELTKAKADKQSYLQMKTALDRQKHNYQILENDYITFKKQNEELRHYIEGLEEERIKMEAVSEKIRQESNHNQNSIDKEVININDELEAQRDIAKSQESFIEELRIEIDQLRKQNLYLKSKLDLLA